MPGELQTDSNQAALHTLNNRLARFQDRIETNLAWFDIRHDLRDIDRYARLVDQAQRKGVKSALKRVLLLDIPWSSNVKFIKDYMMDLAYSPQELEALKAEEQYSQLEKQKIEGEIAGGKDPWLAHIEHNKRSLANPYVIGFYQNTDGKIRCLYGPRHFKSKRQVESSFLAGRTEYKEVNLVSGEFLKIQTSRVLKGEAWITLPEDLRRHFEAGEILITGKQDIYDLNEREIGEISESEDPAALITVVNSKMSSGVDGGGKYFLLYYSDFGSDETGRTGVIMHAEGGEIKPLVVTWEDKEFVVEVKGCGKKSGGFGKMQFRTGREILTGGAEAEQAETEFYRLQDDNSLGSPKPVGSILFINPDRRDYQQGYVIRLTPSTVRAGYTGIDAYPDIEKPEMVNRILDMYVSQLIAHVFADSPKILDRSSHTENLLLWNNGDFAWTDYSDHAAFADKSFPQENNHGSYMTPKQMLEYYIRMVEEIPGYSRTRDKSKFYEHLTEAFKKHGEDLRLELGDDYKAVAQKIWESGMAYQVFKGRKEAGYIPEGVLKEFYQEIAIDYARKELSLDSEEAFLLRQRQGRVDMLKAIDLMQQKLGDKLDPESINEWVQTVKIGSLSQVLHGLDTFYKAYTGNYGAFTEVERSILYQATAYFSQFDYFLVSKFQKYFEHELDVISGAKSGSHPQSKEELNLAEEELKDRMQGFVNLMDTDLGGFYRLIKHPDQVRRLVSFSFYGH